MKYKIEKIEAKETGGFSVRVTYKNPDGKSKEMKFDFGPSAKDNDRWRKTINEHFKQLEKKVDMNELKQHEGEEVDPNESEGGERASAAIV